MLEIPNETLLVLILKKIGAKKVNKFRPISLCITWYKVIMKISMNKLRSLLGDLVNPMQSSFVLRRATTDNAIAARKLMNKIFKKKGSKVG